MIVKIIVLDILLHFATFISTSKMLCSNVWSLQILVYKVCHSPAAEHKKIIIIITVTNTKENKQTYIGPNKKRLKLQMSPTSPASWGAAAASRSQCLMRKWKRRSATWTQDGLKVLRGLTLTQDG